MFMTFLVMLGMAHHSGFTALACYDFEAIACCGNGKLEREHAKGNMICYTQVFFVRYLKLSQGKCHARLRQAATETLGIRKGLEFYQQANIFLTYFICLDHDQGDSIPFSVQGYAMRAPESTLATSSGVKMSIAFNSHNQASKSGCKML